MNHEAQHIKDRQQRLIKLFDRAPMKKTFGMELFYDDQDSALFTMPYNASMDHALGQIHGGIIATLLDNAGWFTVAAHYDTWVSTAEMSFRLLEPVAREEIIATGYILRTGNKLAMAKMNVKTADGKVVAVGSGTFAVTSIEIT